LTTRWACQHCRESVGRGNANETDVRRTRVVRARIAARLRVPPSVRVSGPGSSLLRTHVDVYAFSCYVWNISLVRRVMHAVLSARPDAYVIIGGPQHQARRYLRPERERVVLCNGEGERTFDDLLHKLISRPRSASGSWIVLLSRWSVDHYRIRLRCPLRG
jgi:hypothetical protein